MLHFKKLEKKLKSVSKKGGFYLENSSASFCSAPAFLKLVMLKSNSLWYGGEECLLEVSYNIM